MPKLKKVYPKQQRRKSYRGGFYHPISILILALITLTVALAIFANSGFFANKNVPTPPTPTPQPSPQPTPIVLSPKPGALNVRDILANPTKYINQKVKITARIDIHTGNTDVMCIQNNATCEQFQGTIFLMDIGKTSAGENEEIVLAEKSRTYPSTYNELSCKSSISPIKTCLNYIDGNLTEVEGTFIRIPSESPTSIINMLII